MSAESLSHENEDSGCRLSSEEAEFISSLYEKRAPRMFKQALQAIGSVEGAEDVIQDVFCATMKTSNGIVRNLRQASEPLTVEEYNDRYPRSLHDWFGPELRNAIKNGRKNKEDAPDSLDAMAEDEALTQSAETTFLRTDTSSLSPEQRSLWRQLKKSRQYELLLGADGYQPAAADLLPEEPPASTEPPLPWDYTDIWNYIKQKEVLTDLQLEAIEEVDRNGLTINQYASEVGITYHAAYATYHRAYDNLTILLGLPSESSYANDPAA